MEQQDENAMDQQEPSGGAAPGSDLQDKVIVCTDCGAEFVHTAAAQAFYREKGFANEPKRCAACRKARKTQPPAAGGTRGGPAARQMFKAVCGDCGKETEVPFKPSGARPVYCLDCFRKHRDGGS